MNPAWQLRARSKYGCSDAKLIRKRLAKCEADLSRAARQAAKDAEAVADYPAVRNARYRHAEARKPLWIYRRRPWR